ELLEGLPRQPHGNIYDQSDGDGLRRARHADRQARLARRELDAHQPDADQQPGGGQQHLRALQQEFRRRTGRPWPERQRQHERQHVHRHRVRPARAPRPPPPPTPPPTATATATPTATATATPTATPPPTPTPTPGPSPTPGGGVQLSNLVAADAANAAHWSLQTNLQVGSVQYGD